MARPEKDVDEKVVLALAQRHCSVREIAAVVGVSEDTLYRRYAAVIKKGRADARWRLRDRQWQSAMAGNTTMLIWLGKQMLGQSDRLELTGADGDPLFPEDQGQQGAGGYDYSKLSVEELRDLERLMCKAQGRPLPPAVQTAALLPVRIIESGLTTNGGNGAHGRQNGTADESAADGEPGTPG